MACDRNSLDSLAGSEIYGNIGRGTSVKLPFRPLPQKFSRGTDRPVARALRILQPTQIPDPLSRVPLEPLQDR